MQPGAIFSAGYTLQAVDNSIARSTDWLTLLIYSLTFLLSYSMEQNHSGQANQLSTSQEIPRILWKPKVHYRTYSIPPPLHILNHINPAHAPHPISWRTILILSSHLLWDLASDLFPPDFPTKTLYTPRCSPYMLHAPLISFFWFDYPNNIWWRVYFIKLLNM